MQDISGQGVEFVHKALSTSPKNTVDLTNVASRPVGLGDNIDSSFITPTVDMGGIEANIFWRSFRHGKFWKIPSFGGQGNRSNQSAPDDGVSVPPSPRLPHGF